MATIIQIKADINDNIRTVTTAGGILKTNHADIEDSLAHEIRDRATLQVATTGALAAVSKDNTKVVIVKNVGVFVALETATPPDDITTFASADAGWVWESWIQPEAIAGPEGISTDQPLPYSLDDGLSIWMVKVKPTSSYSLKIGSTNGGEQFASATPLTANQWNTFHFDVDADGGNVTVYFTGVTATTQFAIYRTQLP